MNEDEVNLPLIDVEQELFNILKEEIWKELEIKYGMSSQDYEEKLINNIIQEMDEIKWKN